MLVLGCTRPTRVLQAERADMRANQCDCCGGKLGLVSQSLWSRRFCSRICKQVYKVQKRRAMPWTEVLAGTASLWLDRVKMTIQQRGWAGHLPNAGS
jgi:hypothetical protein